MRVFDKNGPGAPSERSLKAMERYRRAMHGVQSAVAYELDRGLNKDATPKHLRVGVNSAMVETSALVRLLIKKDLTTEEEWFDALADMAEYELALYEKRHAPLRFA
jgi:hypothetical protein